MNIKNVQKTLQDFLEKPSELDLNKTNNSVFVSESNSLRRMQKMLQKVPIMNKLSCRSTIDKFTDIHSINKSFIKNKTSEILTNEFLNNLRNFDKQFKSFENYLQEKTNLKELGLFDPGQFLKKSIEVFLPLKDVHLLVRNVKFSDFNLEGLKKPAYKNERMFSLCEEFHSDQNEYFQLLEFDQNFKELIGKQVHFDFTAYDYASINFVINQSAKMVESNVMILFSFEKKYKPIFQHFFNSQKLKMFSQNYLPIIFKVVQRNSENKLTIQKYIKKTGKMQRLLRIHALQIMQIQICCDANISFNFVPKNYPEIYQIRGNDLVINFPSFEFDLIFFNIPENSLNFNEKTHLSKTIDKSMLEFIESCEQNCLVSLRENSELDLIFISLSFEMKVMDIEIDLFQENDFINNLSLFQKGKGLEEFLCNENLLGEIERHFKFKFGDSEIPAFFSFLFQKWKFTIGMLSILEGHLADDGPKYYLLGKKAAEHVGRICFNFEDESLEDVESEEKY